MKHIKPRSGKLMVEISHKSSEPSSVGANISLTIIYMLVPTGLYFVVHFCFYQKVVPTGLLFFFISVYTKRLSYGIFVFVYFYLYQKVVPMGLYFVVGCCFYQKYVPTGLMIYWYLGI